MARVAGRLDGLDGRARPFVIVEDSVGDVFHDQTICKLDASPSGHPPRRFGSCSERATAKQLLGGTGAVSVDAQRAS
jgi:hypothetical protein